jgi:opacity protein-like surface antigen
MFMFAIRSGLVLVVAALCLSGAAAHAQSASVNYWTPGWLGFGGNLNAGQGVNIDGSFASFDGVAASGFSSTRYNFGNGFFVGNERGGLGGMGFGGMGLSGINQAGAFGSFQTEGVQFGYNFKNSPVTVFGGFDQLKYNSGIGGAFSSPFDSVSGTAGYGAHAGVEFKPASNLSLQLGFSYQQSGTVDTDTKMPSLSNQSQFDLVGGRR